METTPWQNAKPGEKGRKKEKRKKMEETALHGHPAVAKQKRRTVPLSGRKAECELPALKVPPRWQSKNSEAHGLDAGGVAAGLMLPTGFGHLYKSFGNDPAHWSAICVGHMQN